MGRRVNWPGNKCTLLLLLFALPLIGTESTHRLRAYRPHYTSVFQQNAKAELDEVINHHGSRMRREEDEHEEGILPIDYDPYVPPNRRDEDDFEVIQETFIDVSQDILQVNASILVFNVRDINEGSEDYNLEVNLRLYWRDERLAHANLPRNRLKIAPGFTYAVMNPRLIEKLWTPDIFIEHVKNTSQPALISLPSSIRIYPEGDVRYSARITIKMSCQMDFTYYPADTQSCTVGLRSFTFKMDKMNLGWHEPPSILDSFMSHSFDVRVTDGIQRATQNPFSKRGQRFWTIEFDLLLRRKLAFHLWQTFFPSTLFVVTSWTSFWVPPEIVSARTTVCMSALFTQTMMFSSVRQNTPNESYAKALDVWMLICMFFGFLTLLQYTLILKLNSMKVKNKKKTDNEEDEDDEFFKWFNWKNINFNILRRKEEDYAASTITPVSYLSWQYVDGREFIPYHIRRPKLRTQSGNVSPTSGHTSFGFTFTASRSQSPHRRSPSFSPPSTQSSSPLPTKEEQEKKQKLVEDDPEKFKKFTIKMDRISRFAFPAAFLLFNVIYWPTLLIGASYYSF